MARDKDGTHPLLDERAPRRITLARRVSATDPRTAADFLALYSGLSKRAVKDAMSKGAAWVTRARPGSRRTRLRRAKAPLAPGDRVELYYDPRILDLEPPQARCIADRETYSVWFKPAGLLSEGTSYGDHVAILRQVEKAVAPRRRTYLVHRLDREAQGLMVFAHTRAAAANLSRQFQAMQVEKVYLAEVRGDLAAAHGRTGRVELPLDGQAALTEYEVLSYDAARDVSAVRVRIATGRLHQIRRHLDMLGFPVMGDPRYGRGNKNTEGMRLVAAGLAFRDPATGERVHFEVPEAEAGWRVAHAAEEPST